MNLSRITSPTLLALVFLIDINSFATIANDPNKKLADAIDKTISSRAHSVKRLGETFTYTNDYDEKFDFWVYLDAEHNVTEATFLLQNNNDVIKDLTFYYDKKLIKISSTFSEKSSWTNDRVDNYYIKDGGNYFYHRFTHTYKDEILTDTSYVAYGFDEGTEIPFYFFNASDIQAIIDKSSKLATKDFIPVDGSQFLKGSIKPTFIDRGSSDELFSFDALTSSIEIVRGTTTSTLIIHFNEGERKIEKVYKGTIYLLGYIEDFIILKDEDSPVYGISFFSVWEEKVVASFGGVVGVTLKNGQFLFLLPDEEAYEMVSCAEGDLVTLVMNVNLTSFVDSSTGVNLCLPFYD